MTNESAKPSDGVHITGHPDKGIPDLDISAKSLNQILASAEHIWDRTLNWTTDSPIQFLALLIFLAFCVNQIVSLKRDTARFKIEYEERRASAKKQLPLPFD